MKIKNKEARLNHDQFEEQKKEAHEIRIEGEIVFWKDDAETPTMTLVESVDVMLEIDPDAKEYMIAQLADNPEKYDWVVLHVPVQGEWFYICDEEPGEFELMNEATKWMK